MRTNVYVDGFNLYYGAVKGTPYKWLDLRKCCELVFPRNEIHEIHYCTAIVKDAPALADAWPKAVGLAEYATRHGDEFGRIKLIAKIGSALKELDLKDEKTRAAARAVDSNAALLRLLEQA